MKTRTVIHRREFEKRRETLTDVRKRLTLAERTGIDACSTDQHRNVLACDCLWPKAATGIPRISEWRVSGIPQYQPLRC